MVLFGQHPVGSADLRERAAAVKAERGVVIVFGAWQFPSLLRGNDSVSFNQHQRRFFISRQQVGTLEQPAEIFFAGLVQRAFLGGETEHGFIFHGEAFQLYDADIFLALFPDLALAKFHGSNNESKNSAPRSARRNEVLWASSSLLIFSSGETVTSSGHFFLATTFLARPFFGAGLLALDFTAFLVAIVFLLFLSFRFLCAA